MRFTMRVVVVAASLFLASNRTVTVIGTPEKNLLRDYGGRCPKFLPGRQVGTLESDLIEEASGIAASRRNAGVLWVHNDSGDMPRVFAINTKGVYLGSYHLKGAACLDYEDMAIGPGPEPGKDYLYIGDIGDNKAQRSSILVYRVPEPAVDANQSPINVTLTGVEAIRLRYPDKPRDAEVLMVDAITKDIYIISKQEKRSRLYRAAYPQSTTLRIPKREKWTWPTLMGEHSESRVTTMEYKCRLPWGEATGGDISPDGSVVIVRSYFNASIWVRSAGTNLWEAFNGQRCVVPLILEPGGEAVCFDPKGSGYFTVSERKHQPIYYFARDASD